MKTCMWRRLRGRKPAVFLLLPPESRLTQPWTPPPGCSWPCPSPDQLPQVLKVLRFYREESGALLDVSVVSGEGWHGASTALNAGSPRPACHAQRTQQQPPGPLPVCPPRCY